MGKAACALAAIAAICASMPVAAAPRDDLGIVARAFDESALHARDAEPASLVMYNVVRLEPTPTDRLLIRTLHDSRLRPDKEPGATLRDACRVLAENMHASRCQAEPIRTQRRGRVVAGRPAEGTADRSP